MTTNPEIIRGIDGMPVGGTGDVFAELGVSEYRERLSIAAETRRVVGQDPTTPKLAAIVRGQVTGIPIDRLREIARDLFKTKFDRVQESMAREMGDALPQISSQEEADRIASEWTSWRMHSTGSRSGRAAATELSSLFGRTALSLGSSPLHRENRT